MTDRDENRQWHLDKKVPLAMIITIVGQTIFAAWAASNIWTRSFAAQNFPKTPDSAMKSAALFEPIRQRGTGRAVESSTGDNHPRGENSCESRPSCMRAWRA
jgi:hypothetical protein